MIASLNDCDQQADGDDHLFEQGHDEEYGTLIAPPRVRNARREPLLNCLAGTK
jgi:hypothetical protein